MHNGEINTVKGNINWMNSRKHSMKSKTLGEDLDKLWPIIENSPSDSSTFDNALELLVMGGYSTSSAMMLMIPEAWKDNDSMDAEKKLFMSIIQHSLNHGMVQPQWHSPMENKLRDLR